MKRLVFLSAIVLMMLFATPLHGSADQTAESYAKWLIALPESLGSSGQAGVGSQDAGPASGSVTTPVTGQVSVEIVAPEGDAYLPGGPGCDPSYPQLCIPRDAEDLDCDEMGVAGFIVLAPDRHKLDDDGDGLGCED